METQAIEALHQQEPPYIPDTEDHFGHWHDHETREYRAWPEPLKNDGPDYEPPFYYHPCA